MLPDSVLDRIAAELYDYQGSGQSVMEMSHRSPIFMDIFEKTKEHFRKSLSIPDTHEVLFLQGGATTQFAAIPLNLMKESADYAVTGNFSGIAAKEATKYGKIHICADTSDSNHTEIPEQSGINFSENPSYFHYCENNTIYGTQWNYVPTAPTTLVCDMSSNILSKPVDVSKFGMIYAGAQKNMAPAGLTVVIIDKKLAGNQAPSTPMMFNYEQQIKAGSMVNTPSCFPIYVLGLTLDWVDQMGGLAAMEERTRTRANKLYEIIDNSKLFTAPAKVSARSHMNVTFRGTTPELDKQFLEQANKQGLVNLAGHRVVGGMRASIYNAVPTEGVEKLGQLIAMFDK